ncbi:MAG: hypothetical protein P4L55_05560 [Syntrophobacteraceae bacterium]|nr:hypothetical protein [Syntrophobacteraceae bacterium]
MSSRVVWQALLMFNRILRLAGKLSEVGFQMETDKAYSRMAEANRIIEDFPMGKYALYSLLFLAEIALCFLAVYVIKG